MKNRRNKARVRPKTAERFFECLKWTERLQDRLAKSILIIGTGTWQGIWSDCDKPLVGFRAGRECDQETIQREIIKSGIIPTELLRRSRSRLITLPPPNVDDYRKPAGLFGLDELAAKVGFHLDYSAAKVSSLGARLLEEEMADVLCMARRNGIQVGLNQPESLPEVVEVILQDCLGAWFLLTASLIGGLVANEMRATPLPLVYSSSDTRLKRLSNSDRQVIPQPARIEMLIEMKCKNKPQPRCLSFGRSP